MQFKPMGGRPTVRSGQAAPSRPSVGGKTTNATGMKPKIGGCKSCKGGRK